MPIVAVSASEETHQPSSIGVRANSPGMKRAPALFYLARPA
jgi:hypothetical protein